MKVRVVDTASARTFSSSTVFKEDVRSILILEDVSNPLRRCGKFVEAWLSQIAERLPMVDRQN
jgi:hypothetical protein